MPKPENYNVRRDVRLAKHLDQRIKIIIAFYKAKGDENYCFADFARSAFIKEVERVEVTMKQFQKER